MRRYGGQRGGVAVLDSRFIGELEADFGRVGQGIQEVR
jgi:hypothetical protein